MNPFDRDWTKEEPAELKTPSGQALAAPPGTKLGPLDIAEDWSYAKFFTDLKQVKTSDPVTTADRFAKVKRSATTDEEWHAYVRSECYLLDQERCGVPGSVAHANQGAAIREIETQDKIKDIRAAMKQSPPGCWSQATVGVGGVSSPITHWDPIPGTTRDVADQWTFDEQHPKWRGNQLATSTVKEKPLSWLNERVGCGFGAIPLPPRNIHACHDLQENRVLVDFPIEKVKQAAALGMVDGCIHLWSALSTELVWLGFALESERVPLIEKAIGKLFSTLHEHMDKGSDWRSLDKITVSVEAPPVCPKGPQMEWSQEMCYFGAKYQPIEGLVNRMQAVALGKGTIDYGDKILTEAFKGQAQQYDECGIPVKMTAEPIVAVDQPPKINFREFL